MTDGPHTTDPRLWCFERPDADQAFDRAFTRLLSQRQAERQRHFVDAANILYLHHGHTWVRAQSGNAEPAFLTISAEYLVPNKAVVDNDLGVIERCLNPVSEEMAQQFAKNVYQTLNEEIGRAGQVIDGNNFDTLADAYLAMLEKISFSVGRDGNVSLPEMHVGTEQHERMVDLLRNSPSGFRDRLEELMARKFQAAIEEEAKRKARFRRPAE